MHHDTECFNFSLYLRQASLEAQTKVAELVPVPQKPEEQKDEAAMDVGDQPAPETLSAPSGTT